MGSVRVFFLLAVGVTALVGLAAAQRDVHEGSACTLKDGGTGVCTLLYECEPAVKGLLSGNRPEPCSYSGFTPVVCCSKPPPPSASPAEEEVQTLPPLPPSTTAAPRPSSGGKVSERKCVEYGKSVFRIEGTFIPGEKINKSLCGVKGGRPFIIGGSPAEPMEFPHAVIIGYDTKAGRNWLCGGTLISERYVLTAAHCLEDHKKDGVSDPKVVRLGEVSLKVENESDVQEIGIKSFTLHPDYKSTQKYHDIGLIELDRDAVFDGYVRPACLQTSRDNIPEDGSVVGWGKIYEWQYQMQGSGAWSQELRKVVLKKSPYEHCRAKYDSLPKKKTLPVLPTGISDDTMLCYGDVEGVKDACRGDSGGPLHYLRENPYCMYTVMGVTSFGNLCKKADFPGIYTRVSHYVPWIESIVWPNEK